MTSAAPAQKKTPWTDRIGHGLEQATPRFSILYQGPDKSRKTTNALSWPNPFVIYADPNTAALIAWLREDEADRSGRYVLLADFEELQMSILPKIVNRQLEELLGRPVETIVVDPVSAVASMCQDHLMGSSGEFDRKQYGLLKNKLAGCFRQLCAQKKPRGSHPGYNIVLTTHEQAWNKQVGRGPQAEIVLDRVRPMIEGGFKDILPQLVDSVLLTRVKLGAKGPKGRQPPTATVLTQPPDEHYFCGDMIAAAMGREPLPPEVEGDYPTLAKLWGLLPSEEQKDG